MRAHSCGGRRSALVLLLKGIAMFIEIGSLMEPGAG